MSYMAPAKPLLLLLRALRNAVANQLIQCCRHLWTISWRFLQHCGIVLLKLGRFVTRTSQNMPYQTFKGNDWQRSRVEAGPAGNTQILASLLPTDLHRPQSQQSSRRLASGPSLISSSSGFSLNIIPPGDAASVTSSHFERRSSRGDSMTIHSGNSMSSQTFRVSPGANGSRVSVVVPASLLLSAGDVVGPGASGNTGFSQGISDKIYPLMPHKVPRYKRERFIDDKCATYKLDANQDNFSMGELPNGWEQYTHPEGQPYFYFAEKRIITECWIWDREMFRILDEFINQFEDFIRSRNMTQPDDADLLLEVNIEDEVNWCGYYYVSGSTRSVFWLEPFDISTHVSEVRGDVDPTHIKLYLEYQYWYHWDLFPNVGDPTDKIYDLVANTIADARTDIQSSRTSTVNHSKEDLKEMAEIVEGMKSRKFSASHWCLGRFMQLIIKDRFINYHGQYGARLNFSQSIHSNNPPENTWFFTIVSLLLLSAPNVHLKSLNELWVDQITLKARWVKFFVKMNSQWGEHIVHASILLNANVAFLAIPSNDPSNNTTLQSTRTAAQIASYLSIVTSFASMLLALLLVRQHKAKERESLDVGEYHRYVHTHTSSKYSFEGLAVVYSLPYALLTWGYVLFTPCDHMFMCSYILQHGNFPCGIPAYVLCEIEHTCALRCCSCHGANLWTYLMVHLDVLGKFPVAEGLLELLEEEEGEFMHNQSR
ncbi:hypothetical protein H2248_003499 [Termitomyces sp. 'cryptogamus']|nr:hypothetical protein H2248_003499 [Termitomyces sp. 'cryptogamus']